MKGKRIAMSVLAIALASCAISAKPYAAESSRVIFVGDSRTVGMDIAEGISEGGSAYVVAKDGAGFSWLACTAVNEVDKIEAGNPEGFVEVYLFGVNDPGNKERYINWYKSRAKTHSVCVVSVNPVDDCSVSNADVQSFNYALSHSGLDYVDTNAILSRMRVDSTLTTDGLHYNRETYRIIYNLIELHLKETSP